MIGSSLVWLASWAWALLAGVGGLMLLIHEGPSIAACPLTAKFLERHTGLSVASWARFAVAFLIFLVGRFAVVLVLHQPFLPQ